MRITADEKVATRERILEAAARLLARDGWEQATTRAIAAAASIASGTLFNYFPSKEAIAAELVATELEKAREEFTSRHRGDESIEEEVFAFIWTGFRHLAGYRRALGPALAAIFNPLGQGLGAREGEPLRVRQLEEVTRILAAHGFADPPPVLLELYWTLYLGTLGRWLADESPHQEETLTFLDRALGLLVAAMRAEAPEGGAL